MDAGQRRHLGMFLAALLAAGLVAFAAVNVMRWEKDRNGMSNTQVALKRVSLAEAPAEVQAAAARLASSRVGYAIGVESITYVIVSTGKSGEGLELAWARQDPVTKSIMVNLKSAAAGDQLLIAAVQARGPDGNVRFLVDRQPGVIPTLVNEDRLPLVELPETGSLTFSPAPGVRVIGNVVQVTGFARVKDGAINVQIQATGKGRIIGEMSGIRAAAAAPDWGSFLVNVAVTLPQGMREGVVYVYDPDSGAKLSVPVRFAQ